VTDIDAATQLDRELRTVEPDKALWAAVVLTWGVRYGSGYGRIATAARQR
jgi:hypothetical protein